ncbi:hypothetical protein D9M72_560910 [compost metagenome]
MKTHTGRNSSTASRITAQPAQIRPAPSESSWTPSMMVRTCKPISRNTEFSSRNCTVFQLLRWLSRAAPLGMDGALVPITSPVTTTASTPEAWIASAGR